MADESFNHSITLLISDLKEGDNRAAQQLWDHYFPKLIRYAGKRLGNASRRIADEEDVALSVFESLFDGAQQGRFERLQNRDDLWKLLVAITGMKSADHVRRETAQKRGGGQVRGHSVFVTSEDGEVNGFEQFAETALSPEFLTDLEEQQARLLSLLPDDSPRRIAMLRLEGMSHEEIARELDISIRSVARKFKLIRDIWGLELRGAS